MRRRIVIILILLIYFVYLVTDISIYDFDEKNTIYVEVKGEVINEKIYEIAKGSTVDNLLKIIELKSDADISGISRLDKLYNNQILVIPKNRNINLVSINSAVLEDLINLPGIGESLALRIIDYRKNNGSFIKLEELMNVSGIGEKKYEKIKPFICL